MSALSSRAVPIVAGGTPVAPRRRRRPRWPLGYLAPAVLILGLTYGYSFVQVVRYSFYAGDIGQLTYVGTGNYSAIFHDPVFTQSLLDNVKLLITVPVMTVLALVVALIINTGIRGWRAYRSVIFVPYILPATAMGLAFSYLLQGGGVVDTLMRSVGLGPLVHDWLGSPHWVLYSIGGVIVWQQLGFGVVVFSAALLNVPTEIIEAARIDGASWWRLQRSIMVPQIRRIIEFFVILEAIAALSSVFTYVFVLTQGGPAYSSSVMELYIYQNGFENGAIGLASAAAVVLLAAASILIVAFVWLRARSAREAA